MTYQHILHDAERVLDHFGVVPLPLVRNGSVLSEQYQGIRAIFNGDLHLALPGYAPREDWIVDRSPAGFSLRLATEKGEVAS